MERDVPLPAAGAQSSRAVHDLRGSEEAAHEGRPQRGQRRLLVPEQFLGFIINYNSGEETFTILKLIHLCKNFELSLCILNYGTI